MDHWAQENIHRNRSSFSPSGLRRLLPLQAQIILPIALSGNLYYFSIVAWEIEHERIFQQVFDEHLRQHQILHSDPPRKSRQDLRGTAFNIGLTSDQLTQEIETNPSFQDIYKIALDKNIPYQEAQILHERTIEKGEKLLDKISRFHNSRQPYPKEPKPARIFTEFHKPRKKPTKEQLVKKAEGYMRWKEASDAINTEEATPLD